MVWCFNHEKKGLCLVVGSEDILGNRCKTEVAMYMILCVIILRDTEKKDKSQQLTIFYGGKVLVFNDFPADKAKDLMQLASKSSPVVQNVGVPQPSAPATVTDNTKVHKAMPAPVSSLPVAQASDAKKPARANASGTCYFLFFLVVTVGSFSFNLQNTDCRSLSC